MIAGLGKIIAKRGTLHTVTSIGHYSRLGKRSQENKRGSAGLVRNGWG
jgi:hypothetical protein